MSEDMWPTPLYVCVNCGKRMGVASASPVDPDPRPPQEGDVSVCLYCSHVMIFSADRTYRAPTPEEMDEIASDPDVLNLLQAMHRLRTAMRDKGLNDEILPGRARFRRVVRAEDGPPDGEHVSQDRDAGR